MSRTNAILLFKLCDHSPSKMKLYHFMKVKCSYNDDVIDSILVSLTCIAVAFSSWSCYPYLVTLTFTKSCDLNVMTSPVPPSLASCESTPLDPPVLQIWWPEILWRWRCQPLYISTKGELTVTIRFSKSGRPIYDSKILKKWRGRTIPKCYPFEVNY